MKALTRYTRSFIGLMEMCNTGNWVKYSDAKQIIDELSASVVELEYKQALLEKTAGNLNKICKNQINELARLHTHNKRLKDKSYARDKLLYGVAASLLITAIVVLYFA